MSKYIIGRILRQLILVSRHGYLIGNAFCKIIFIKRYYKIYNNEFLAIIEAFKIWQYYLKNNNKKSYSLSIITTFVIW